MSAADVHRGELAAALEQVGGAAPTVAAALAEVTHQLQRVMLALELGHLRATEGTLPTKRQKAIARELGWSA